MTPKFVLAILGSLICFLPSAAPAAEQPAAADQAQLESARQLVKQLGSPQFRSREAAMGQLLGMGLAIKPALSAGMKDQDAEIRERSERVLVTLLEADFQKRLKLFAADADGSRGADMPGWSRFKSEIGSDSGARSLFVEMQRAEPSLMAAYGESADMAAGTLQTRCTAVAGFVNPMLGFGGRDMSSLTISRVAALYFVAADAKIKVGGDVAQCLRRLYLFVPSLQLAMSNGPQSELIRHLLAAWIAKDFSPDGVEENLNLALQMNLKEACPTAIAALKEGFLSSLGKFRALMMVDRFGGKDDLPIVTASLQDVNVCPTVLGLNQPVKELQVRDVALSVVIRLSGEDPAKFGLRPMPNQIYAYQAPQPQFNSAAERDAAFKKWADHVAAQKNAAEAKDKK